MKYFTEIKEGLLEGIEEKSNILWEEGENPTDYKLDRNYLCLGRINKPRLTHNHFYECVDFKPLGMQQFIEKCKELNPKKKGRWAPKEGGVYFYKNSHGNVYSTVKTRQKDKCRVKIGNYYKTEKICALSIELELAKLEYENAVDTFNDDWVPNFENIKQCKYFFAKVGKEINIYHDTIVEVIGANYMKSDPIGTIDYDELKKLYSNYHNTKQAFEKEKREGVK